MSEVASAIHSVVLRFDVSVITVHRVFVSQRTLERPLAGEGLPVATGSACNRLTSSFCRAHGAVCPRPLSGSGRVYFPFHQGARCCQAGRPAIGWEEGSNLNCLLYLANQGSRLTAGSERRCLGGVWHLCLSPRLPGLLPGDSFRAGIVPLCHLPQATEAPRRPAWPSVMLDRVVQQIAEVSGNAGLDFLKVSPFETRHFSTWFLCIPRQKCQYQEGKLKRGKEVISV